MNTIKNGAITIVYKGRNEILLVKRRDIPIWIIPGGGIEPNETPEEAAKRETFEESGVIIKDIKRCGVYMDSKTGQKIYLHTANYLKGTPSSSDESQSSSFFNLTSLPLPYHPHLPTWLLDSKTPYFKKELMHLNNFQILANFYKYPTQVMRYFLFTIFGIRINT